MDVSQLQSLLSKVQAGQLEVEEALTQLKSWPIQHLGHTRLDTHRALRNGLPEVVFCQNKTSQQIVEIMQGLAVHHRRVLGTRATPEQANYVSQHIPQVNYDPTSRLLRYGPEAARPVSGDDAYILVATGGTSDIPVAEEAAQTAEFFGNRVVRAYDVGVAGVHRLLDLGETLFEAAVIIAVAGMEGALATVIGGLVACPVIGVPTSVGYGASFGGVAALLAMLNSCATGVAVVNIDNGFGAATFAHAILRQRQDIA
jgi:hypothetical protein